MGDHARDVTNDPLAIRGLEDLLTQHTPGASSGFSQAESSFSQDNPGQASGFSQEVTVEKAAEILGLSTNAIHKRLRKGKLKGRKAPGKFKDQWLILLDDTQIPLAIEIEPEPGASSGFSQDEPSFSQDNPGQASGSNDSPAGTIGSEMLVRELMTKVEQLQHRNGYLEALLETERQQVRLLTDSQHKRGWWTSFCSWFLGQKEN